MNAKYSDEGKIKITKGKRFKYKIEKGPGPGDYTPNDKDSIPSLLSTHKRIVSFSFGNLKRKPIEDIYHSKLPGPGRYRNLSEFGYYDVDIRKHNRPANNLSTIK